MDEMQKHLDCWNWNEMPSTECNVRLANEYEPFQMWCHHILTYSGFLFFSLQSCTLSFHSTSSSNEGSYAVQLEMEDFPDQTISLLQSDGVETSRTPTDALSKIPVRFALTGKISVNILTFNSAKTDFYLHSKKTGTLDSFYFTQISPKNKYSTHSLHL